ncbi:phosphoribosyltransferase family protein [Wenzhouxiangella marina]|uniref:Phosphoribosyltransferase n=1 Tax=Wenzhouxiangella marina TaxID=1579979 RepID=A0A0K0XVT3_9GAMM|nr:phosphoribosyltransferase family protein [Wenzhouxiangella marina]AKS41726.1 Phosphoribosyltransferase [Wenzhouxiangella marina]MBB6086512.1 hypoxanthine phosphoribosyltransferase [Wenzhouxiangella marina]
MSRAERWADAWPEGAECLITPEEVAVALDAQARRLDEQLGDRQDLTIMALMNGGMYPAVELARRLDRPLRMDHLHASRYREAMSGGEMQWGRWPDRVQGTILLVDDIFDEGYTMQAVAQRLRDEGADEVITVAMVLKEHERGLPRNLVDDAALRVPDRYVFGCGMDWKGLWRQLDGIWAVGEAE